jgi:hypothetical protein
MISIAFLANSAESNSLSDAPANDKNEKLGDPYFDVCQKSFVHF